MQAGDAGFIGIGHFDTVVELDAFDEFGQLIQRAELLAGHCSFSGCNRCDASSVVHKFIPGIPARGYYFPIVIKYPV